MTKAIKKKIDAIKRESLLTEASRLFESVGYEQMKIADLAKNAGVSIGTIYGFFGSKEGLYMAYARYQLETFWDEFQNRLSPPLDAAQRLRVYITLKFRAFHEKRTAILQTAKDNPLFFNIIHNELAEPMQAIHDFQTACFREINPKLDEERALRLAFAFEGFGDGYVSRWLINGDDLTQYVDEVCDTFICMVKGCV